MENAAKALEIAAGVLLAVMIMALVSYFFSNIKSWPEEEEQMKDAEQLSAFNKEYEVYDKTAMYGADVISCLNKVKNNNEKYVQGFSFTYGDSYGNFDANKNTYTYLINLKLKISSPLEESIEVYFNNPNTKRESQVFSGNDLVYRNGPNVVYHYNVTLAQMGFNKLNKSTSDNSYYTNFLETDTLQKLFSGSNNNVKTLVDPKGDNKFMEPRTDDQPFYEFFTVSGLKQITINSEIASLLNMTDNMTQNVRNKDVNGYNDWTSAEWKTAAYSFKKKRFKCVGLHYNSSTGRVDEISFVEI